MEMEYKVVGVSGMNVVDKDQGIVEALVSVTNVVDNVKDVIKSGAYEKSLAARTPKGAWSHAWDTPVSKALEAKELLPGDPGLPATRPDGQPWPAEAGALYVKAQFNLDTQRGREAFSDVIFFGDEQEWSIGYQVPVGGATIDKKTGQRHIDHLELYEFSPVLFGAMPLARSQSVKDAQVALKSLTMPTMEFKEWCNNHGLDFKGDNAAEDEQEDDDKKPAAEATDTDQTPDDDENLFDLADDDEEDDDEDGAEEKAYPFDFTAYERETLVATRDAINGILATMDKKTLEEAIQSKSLAEIVATFEEALDADVYSELKDAAAAFDSAIESGDAQGVQEAGGDVLTVVEDNIEDAEGDALDALTEVAQQTAELAEDFDYDEADEEKTGEDDEEFEEADPDSEGDATGEEDTEEKDEEKSLHGKKPLPKKRTEVKAATTVELKSVEALLGRKINTGA